ncbi:MAG: Asp-tRNA(Asn)/Glu-tRNA(Gln) amidotransferase subunit GatB [Rickettsiales bacterium]|jgi:aspartyl-tRNA(Asn)/glutamyl-tRNA(Gln) amidotransferase subunit B|nr:Asp-tRNA(Asn)/Glu-tRNA(Gln) amidotransferase subunit GatB [Rickettsiales bacterium]
MTYTVKSGGREFCLNIGLEIHCEITSESKLFSAQSAKFGGAPNTRVSFFDAGFPGQLPVLNDYCIDQAIKTGLGLSAKINGFSVFARKHYFYADLPAGYQISQFDRPLVSGGAVEVTDDGGNPKSVRIERLHVEQDAGKLSHDKDPSRSMVDFNRAGVGLMEIVSRPDMSSPKEVGEYVRSIRALVRYLGTCDGNMDEGSMRCDINVSLRPVGSGDLGTRTETKNVNSVKFAMQAVEYEAGRQAEILASGGKVVQETRLFDAATGTTRPMRNKENAIDYRYFPDPDIMPLVLEEGRVERIRASMPELPAAKRERLKSELGLSDYDARQIAADRDVAEYFEETARLSGDGKAAANWILSELFAHLNAGGLDIAQSSVRPPHLAELISLVKEGEISGRMAKDIFAEMFSDAEKSARRIASKKGLRQISDPDEIGRVIDGIMAANPENVKKYRAGKAQIFGWFVGQAIKETKGLANPDMVNEILKGKLA